MKFTPITFNGVSLNDSNFKAFLPLENSFVLQAAGEPVEIERAFLPPDYATKTLKSKTIPIIVQMLGDVTAQIDTLKSLFNTRDFTPRLLVVQDQNSTNWQLYATCISHVKVQGRVTIFNLYIADDSLYSVNSTTSTWTITNAATSTKTVTPAGTAHAQPIITITPVSGSGDYVYKRFIRIQNTQNIQMVNIPIDVFGSDLSTSLINTASLVSAGHMRSDGADIRLVVDGKETNLWLANMNTAYTAGWTVIPSLDKYWGLTITSGISAAGLDTITFPTSTTAKATLARIKTKSIFYIGTEIIECDIPNLVNQTMVITERGARGTTAAAHSTGTVMTLIEHDIWLKYGMASQTTGTVNNDALKPMFTLTTSTNASWVFNQFRDTTTAALGGYDGTTRPASWLPTATSSYNVSSVYNVAHKATPDTAIAAVMGHYVHNSASGIEKAQLKWTLNSGLFIQSYSGAYAIYSDYSPVTYWPASPNVGVQWGTNAVVSFINYPSVISTWQTGTFSSTTSGFSPALCTIFYTPNGLKKESTAHSLYMEITQLTVGLYTNYFPTISIGNEQASYSMNATITNNATGEYIKVVYPLSIGQSLVIDCSKKTATISGRSVYSALAFSSTRVNWFDLLPAANQLQYDASFSSSLSITVAWQDRLL